MFKTIAKFFICLLFISNQFLCLAQVNLQNGLVGYYPFDGNINDLSGNNNNCTSDGVNFGIDRFGIPNKAIQLNGGTVGGITTDRSFSFTNEMSISVWLNLKPSGSKQQFYDIATEDNPNYGPWALNITDDSSGNFIYGFGFANQGSYWESDIKYSENKRYNEWIHLVVTLGNNEMKLFVDGHLKTSKTTTSINFGNYNQTVTIGYDRYRELLGNLEVFNGMMDDLYAYNRVLNKQEVDSLYRNRKIDLNTNLVARYPFNGNANDESGNGLNGTVTGASLTTDRFGNANSAYSFNGVNQLISLGNPSAFQFPNGSSFSLSAWFYTNTTTNQVIVSHGTGSYAVYLQNQKKDYVKFSSSTVANNDSSKSGNPILPLNQWNHLVVINNIGSNVLIYINNTLANPDLNSQIFTNSYTYSHPLEIGRSLFEGYFFSGKIDDISIYNRALNPTEIKDLFDARNPNSTNNENIQTKFGFYTINRDSRNLCFTDTLGNVNIIGPTGIDPKYLTSSVGSLEFDRQGNLWFSSKNDSIYTINRKTGLATLKFEIQHPYLNITNGIYFNALSFNSKNEMYSWLEPAGPSLGRLIKVTDLNTGATSALSGGTSSDINEVFAIDFGDNDTLWSLDQCCYRKLHILDTATGLSISKSTNVLNIENFSDMDYSYSNIYGMNIVGYNSATSTGFFKTTRNGTPTSLFSLQGQYIGMAGFNQVIYTDSNRVCQTVTVISFQTVTVTSINTITVTKFLTTTVTSIITVHDCGTVSGINQVGRSEVTSISVFPNPANDKIFLDSKNQMVFSVDVVDSRGISILSTYYPSSIDVANWPNGVYLLRAKDKEGVVLKTFKISKE